MKHLFILSTLFIAVLLSSCESKTSEELIKAEVDKINESLESLKTEHDIDKQIIKNIKTQLALINAEKDTTKKGEPVTLLAVKDTTFQHFIDVQGVVESDNNIDVTTDMGGLVTSIKVTEGQRVSKGQILAATDNAVILSNIEEIKTGLEIANITFDKQQRLWNQNIGSEIQYLQAKNQKESLEKKLATAQTQLSKTYIKSPITGTVDEVHLKVGEMASPGYPAFRVVNLNQLEVKVDIPEIYLGKVKKNDAIKVTLPSLNLTVDAKVKTVGQVVNSINRTFTVRASVPNKNGLVKPNLLAQVKIKDYENKDALIIPSKLLQSSANGENYVFTAVKDSATGNLLAKKVIVKIGSSYQTETEVLSGLNGTDQLINDGYRNVYANQLLEVSTK